MKYRLSTVLLLTTCIALALGWYVDRHRLNSRHRLNTDQVARGAGNVRAAVNFLDLDTAKPAELAEQVETRQILRVFSLFKSVEAVKQYNRYYRETWGNGSYNYSAFNLAAALLETLHCTSADQYFDRLKLLDQKGELADYQPGGEQYKAFRQFVEESLQSNR